MRTVLDLIGYATLPDDAVVAQSVLHRFFLWVLTVPSWLTFVVAFGAYAWLTYVSWPRQSLAGGVPEEPQVGNAPLNEQEIMKDATELKENGDGPVG